MPCNAAIYIANIEGGKLACVHTQNSSKCWIFADLVTYVCIIMLCNCNEHLNGLLYIPLYMHSPFASGTVSVLVYLLLKYLI